MATHKGGGQVISSAREALGCPDRETCILREQERVAKKKLDDARLQYWVRHGTWPPDDWVPPPRQPRMRPVTNTDLFGPPSAPPRPPRRPFGPANAPSPGVGFGTRRNVPRLRTMLGGKTRKNKTSGGDIVTHLLTIRNQIKLYHWQTSQFARHKATDDLTAALDLNIDAFVESYMGRYGRPMVSGSIKLHNFSESAAKAFVARETKYLEKELPKKIGKGDTDLLNMRDTILGDLTKASYLFTLQ